MNETAMTSAARLLDLGRAEQAEEAARQLLAEWPDDWRAQLVLGRALLSLGRVHEAEAVLSSAAAQQPDDARVLMPLAEARLSLGKAREAEKLVAVVLRQAPEDASALWLRCRILMRLRRRREVYPALRLTLDATADPVFSHRAMAHVARWAGAPLTAEAHLRAALAFRPDDPALLRELAEVSGHRGTPTVRELLVAAIRLDPAHRGAVDTLGSRTRANVTTAAVATTAVYLLLAAGIGYLAGFPQHRWSFLARGIAAVLGFAIYRLAQWRLWADVPRDVAMSSRLPGLPLLSVPLGCTLVAASSTGRGVLQGVVAAVVSTSAVNVVRHHLAGRPIGRPRLFAAAAVLLVVVVVATTIAVASVRSQDALRAVVAVCGAALAAAGAGALALWRPGPPPYGTRGPGRWPRASFAVAAWPSTGVILLVALPLIFLYAPLFVVATRTRAARPDSRLRPLVFGGVFLLDGLIVAAIILAVGGTSAAPYAVLALIGFASNALSQAARARRRLIPSWMVLPAEPPRNPRLARRHRVPDPADASVRP